MRLLACCEPRRGGEEAGGDEEEAMEGAVRLSEQSSLGVKVVVIGAVRNGKSSLIMRFLHHYFSDTDQPLQTIGAAFASQSVLTSKRMRVTLNIWDTGGEERFSGFTRSYFRGAQAAVVCFQIGNSESLEKAQFWYNQLREVEESTRLYLCGTKLDLVHAGVVQRNGEDEAKIEDILAKNYYAKRYETSSKTGEGVQRLFRDIAEDFAVSHGTRSNPLATKRAAWYDKCEI